MTKQEMNVCVCVCVCTRVYSNFRDQTACFRLLMHFPNHLTQCNTVNYLIYIATHMYVQCEETPDYGHGAFSWFHWQVLAMYLYVVRMPLQCVWYVRMCIRTTNVYGIAEYTIHVRRFAGINMHGVHITPPYIVITFVYNKLAFSQLLLANSKMVSCKHLHIFLY